MPLIGVCVADLHIPEARSLKDKRRIIKGLVDRLRQRHRFAVAETAFLNLRQRAQVTMAVVGIRESELEQTLERARRLVENQPIVIASWDLEVLELANGA